MAVTTIAEMTKFDEVDGVAVGGAHPEEAIALWKLWAGASRRTPPLSGSINKEGTQAMKQRCSGASVLLKLILRLCDVLSSASLEDFGESAQVSGNDR